MEETSRTKASSCDCFSECWRICLQLSLLQDSFMDGAKRIQQQGLLHSRTLLAPLSKFWKNKHACDGIKGHAVRFKVRF